MRLQMLDSGQRPLAQFVLNTFKRIAKARPGPIAVNSYHRDLFGKQFAICIQDAMRRHSDWHKSELELFAAFISNQLACQF